MKQIFSHENSMIVNSAKNILEHNGIESVIKNEHGGTISARHGIQNIFYELWILNDQDYEQAADIIKNEVEDPPLGEPWYCENCKEANEGSFEICWRCQAPQPGT